MHRLLRSPLAVLCACLTAYGCGESGSSSAVVELPVGNVDVLSGVSLVGSFQGKAAGLADVDGDGIPDKLVGAPYATTPTNGGVVLVYKGDAAGGFASTPSSLLTGDDLFGWSFVRLPKASENDTDKFAIGALYGDGSDVSLGGSVSLYQGGSGGPKLLAKLAGEGPMDRFGSSLAAGDLDGDGYTDIAVGAQSNSPVPARYQQGAVYVYFGPQFTRNIALYASSTNTALGGAVAIGDINGDGKADLLLSASGKVLAYYGGPSFAFGSSTPVSVNSPDVTIASTDSGFGKSIAVLGDVNADKVAEIAIGAPNAVVGTSADSGAIYILRGTARGIVNLGAATRPADLIVKINGANLFDRFGTSIIPVGDVDGDGKADFAVGANLADVNTNDLRGKVYLFRGKDISASTTLAASTTFKGFMMDQSYGTSLAPAGAGKLLIGGPTAEMYAGGVFMIDLVTGKVVTGGSHGGGSGAGYDCTNMPELCK